MKQMSEKLFRPCVAIVLFNEDAKILVAARNDQETDQWQLPQGGIENGETAIKAAFRELEEEIGTNNAVFLKESTTLISYEIPPELRKGWMDNKWIGQSVKAVALKFIGTETEICLGREEAEFRAWKWEDLSALPELIIGFKQDLYRQIVREFSPIREDMLTRK